MNIRIDKDYKLTSINELKAEIREVKKTIQRMMEDE